MVSADELDHADLQTLLASFDGSNISGDAATNDHEVPLFYVAQASQIVLRLSFEASLPASVA